MAIKTFFTGVTGYIGGDALYATITAHPDWEYTCLVRTEGKAEEVKKAFPNVKIVIGDLDSKDVIEEEATKADIVFNLANCDHEGAAAAIARGLRSSGGYLLHVSGTGILTWPNWDQNVWGEPVHDSPKAVSSDPKPPFNDWDGVDVPVSKFPDRAFHRCVDQIVLGASEGMEEKLKTAIVCPPTIFGPGRGPGNRKSKQVYSLVENQLKRKKGFMVGKGTNLWNSVNVQDLSALFLLLGEAAAAEIEGGKTSKEGLWNKTGYYFSEMGETFCWGDVAKECARIAHQKGLLPSAQVEQLSRDETDKMSAYGMYSWGSHSVGFAVRARKLLGWECVNPKLQELLGDIVELEARELGLL